ncbi:F-box only protein 25-like [Ostrea edulis]|uniref:F-box only protein 25-like n=1 Tax=Ostrea edulis TaxID=37623 RepID=UPI002094A2A8|nr:F-box only protein 25-like [Ostrea edulis]
MEASSRGNAYVKINGLWVIASLGSDPDSSKGKFRDNRDEPSHQDNSQRIVTVQIDNSNGVHSIPLPVLRNITGIGRHRKTHESVSTALEKLKFEEYTVQLRKFSFCCEFYRVLMKHKLHRLSGTVQKYIFHMLEQMTNTAISLELFISPLRQTLKEVFECVSANERSMIGSKSMRRKHHDLVSNCLTRISLFQYTEREDDGNLSLLDLPKECLINIIKKLDQPHDIINVALTCSTLEVIAMDNAVWESMCFHHFNDKEIGDFVSHMELYSVDWLEVFKICSKKSKSLKKLYGDQLVLCNNCRGLFWRTVGHDCMNPDKQPSNTPISPAEFLDLLNL